MRSNESFMNLMDKVRDVETFCHTEEATNHAETMFLVVEELLGLRREVWNRDRALKNIKTKIKNLIERISKSLDSQETP